MKKLIALLCLFFLSGCVTLDKIPDYIAGTYVRQPEEGTPGRYIKTFDAPYGVSFDKIEAALKDMNVPVRYKSKKEKVILAWYFDKIYDKCIDTTKVSVYFKEITPDKTEIHVACGNYGLAKFASEELFKRL